jgi:hypothetical protein
MEAVKSVLSEAILEALKEKLIEFRDTENIGSSTVRYLSINGLIDSIEGYFDMRKHVQPQVESIVKENLTNILMDSKVDINKVNAKLANFLPYFAEFLIKSDSTYKNPKVIQHYLDNTKNSIQIIRETLDSMTFEMERVEYTFKVTGDFGLLNAYSFLENQLI